MLEWDQRDNPLFPKNGRCVKMIHELAGFGGDVHFSKAEIISEYIFQLYKDWVSVMS